MKFLNKYWSFLNEGASLDQIYDKFYKDKVKREIFEELIKADPTTRLKNEMAVKKGKYSYWIIKSYIKTMYKNRFYEDLYKIKDGLSLYDRYKHMLDVGERDVNMFTDINHLLDVTDQFKYLREEDEAEEVEMSEIHDNTIKILDNKQYLVVIPQSEESSCYYGKGTRWCTAADHYNRFDMYNRDGNLYIIIDRENGEKYQLHVATNQYMDASDEGIELKQFIKNNQEAILPIIDWIMTEVDKLKDNDENTDKISKLIGDVVTFSTEGISDRLKKFLTEKPKYTKKVPLLIYLTSLREELGDARIGDYMRRDGKDYLIVNDFSDLSEFFKNEDFAKQVLSNESDDHGDYYYTDGWDVFDDSVSDVIGCMKDDEELNRDIRHLMIDSEVIVDGDKLEITKENYMSFDISEAWENDDDTVPEEVRNAYGYALSRNYVDKVWDHYSNSVLTELGDGKFEWLYSENKGISPQLMVNITHINFYVDAYMGVNEEESPSELKPILVEGLKEGEGTSLIWFDSRWDEYPDFLCDEFTEAYYNR